MASRVRYDLVKYLIMKGLAQRNLEAFNKLFSSSESTSTADMFETYLNQAANLFAKAHPDGWPWQHVVTTFGVTTSTTHTYAVTHSLEIISSTGSAGTVWSTNPVPKDMGFYNVMARTAAGAAGGAVTRGDYIPVQRIEYLEAVDRGLINRDTYVNGKVQQYWWTARNGLTYTFETAPYTLVAVSAAATCNCVELYLPYRRTLPTVTAGSAGTDTDIDPLMIWPAQDDVIVALFGRALCAAQMQDWTLYRGSIEQAMMMTRARLSDMSVHAIGLDFERLLVAKDEIAKDEG